MRLSRLSSDDGSASIEFLTVGLLLLVPLVGLVLALDAVQRTAFAVEGAARHAARVFVQQSIAPVAEQAAARAIATTLDDYGVDAETARVVITCAPHPSDCLAPRGIVTVRVTAVAALPLLPPALGVDVPLGVPIEAAASVRVSRFAG